MESTLLRCRARLAAPVLAAAVTVAAGCLPATGPVAKPVTPSKAVAASGPSSPEPETPEPAPRLPLVNGPKFYVSPSGSDGAAGSRAAPWKTLSKAFASLSPGDTLYARGGTYVERVDPVYRKGTADKPIAVMAFPGERPVLSGLLRITNADFWIFDGLNVTWNPDIGTNTDHMVKITNGRGWTYRNAEIWGARSYAGMLVAGTTAGQPANWTVSRNVIHDIQPTNKTNQDHCIYANTGTSAGRGVIEQNVLYNATNGEGIKLGPPGEEGGSANVVIRYNTIYNTAQSVLLAYDTSNIEIYGNLLGKVKGKYGHLRGFRLRGAGNVAHNNMGYAAGSMIMNDAGYTGIQDAGGNVFPADPKFDRIAPDGFHPTDERARRFGARVDRVERLRPPGRDRATAQVR